MHAVVGGAHEPAGSTEDTFHEQHVAKQTYRILDGDDGLVGVVAELAEDFKYGFAQAIVLTCQV